MKIGTTAISGTTFTKALIMGESGSGKTFTASTIDGKVLVISAEKGTLCLADHAIDCLDLSVDDEGKPILEAKDRLTRLSGIFKLLQAGTSYTDVFLDSLTEVSELVITALNKEFPDRKDSLPMYGENAKRMTSIIKSFRDLPYNVYMTCLAKSDKDENGRRFMGLSLTGKIADVAPQYFDFVFYVYPDEAAADGKRMFITRKSATNICKDRSGKLLPVEPADLGSIACKIAIPRPVNQPKEKKNV